VLGEAMAAATGTDVYVFRPCIVAGPDAPALLSQLPYLRLEEKVPTPMLRALGWIPGVKPVLPDHGIPFQLVHHDDVADALVAATLGQGEPGIYNLAASGVVTISDIADELGWHSVSVPKASVGVAAQVLSRIPPLAVDAGWLEALRTSVVMDTTRARERLGWKPAYDAPATLHDLVAAARTS
jgi:nucleoside-diphosphate-sugar epimerase